jgi:hypothetical protein
VKPSAIADLYGLPLDEFTSARNDLAARLKADGKSDEARAVKALKRPTIAAWAVNQLARQDPEALRRLTGLRDQIVAASSAAELRALTEQRRHALAGVVESTRTVLSGGGHSPTAATIDKVVQTLLASVDDEAAARVSTGTLERELTSSSAVFGPFAASTEITEIESGPDVPDPKLERLQRAADEAERAARELERAALNAETAAEAARQRAAEARRHADKLRARIGSGR